MPDLRTFAPIPDDRPLSPEERALAAWLLEHGGADARGFLPQLERARVVARCGCGCASVDFAVAGLPKPQGGLRTLAEFLYGAAGDLHGVFIFEQGGVLGGIEVWALDSLNPSRLPAPEELRPYDEAAFPAEE